MTQELLNVEMRRYSQKIKNSITPIMEEILDLHEGHDGALVLTASALDAFISFLYTVCTPSHFTPEEKLDKVKELLDYFIVTYAEKEILKEETI